MTFVTKFFLSPRFSNFYFSFELLNSFKMVYFYWSVQIINTGCYGDALVKVHLTSSIKTLKITPEKGVFVESALNMRCYMVIKTLLHTAFFCSLVSWGDPYDSDISKLNREMEIERFALFL